MLLCLAMMVVGVCWCAVLPTVSKSWGHGEVVHVLEDCGVDAAAMFYTEHERLLKP